MGTHSLKITKVYKAPPEKVFNAWADKKQMLKWMGPGDVKCEKIEIDFKVGGKYQIFMLTPDGPMTAYGEYLEIDPPKKLSFTWGWRQNDLDGSIVTLTFKEMDGSTEMTLEHSNFPAADVAEHHKMGWTSIADKLGRVVEA